MIKRRQLPFIGKFAFMLLIIFSLGFVFYEKSDAVNTPVQLPETVSPLVAVQKDDSLKNSIVDYGIEFLGTPYVTAGSGRDGFDCSGFVHYVFRHFNIKVPRTTADFQNFGQEIPIEHVQKGDLLLFLSPTRNVVGHIGIVTSENGRESQFIHASSGPEMRVIFTDLSKPSYTRRFVKAIRVI
ncbi:C40 family peptidase [Algoriphagus sp.]|uniref:C40 family peptidase n=1 Tax=Algoriphagus sp. TaxID=1872435 RepID=UPI0027205799|nr:C40 family peptidase [Algoriphagus sp.]MDO8967615.1 C40 family peptidase [Algoriphagus sp.]MDP3198584.1 C40 family peptidase [Algoriphagus sp.]